MAIPADLFGARAGNGDRVSHSPKALSILSVDRFDYLSCKAPTIEPLSTVVKTAAHNN